MKRELNKIICILDRHELLNLTISLNCDSLFSDFGYAFRYRLSISGKRKYQNEYIFFSYCLKDNSFKSLVKQLRNKLCQL